MKMGIIVLLLGVLAFVLLGCGEQHIQGDPEGGAGPAPQKKGEGPGGNKMEPN